MKKYYLYINGIYRNLIECDVLPRIGDTIKYNDYRYSVSNVEHVISSSCNTMEINVYC